MGIMDFIGEREVIYFDKGKRGGYVSLKENNGIKDQRFLSSDLPSRIVVECFDVAIVDGALYGYYLPVEWTFKKLELAGRAGYENAGKELDSICQILTGKTEDGREICFARSVRIEDINKIAGVRVDLKEYQVLLDKKPEVDIDELKVFGTKKSLLQRDLKCLRNSEGISEGEITISSYGYKLDNLDIDAKQRSLIINDNNSSYYLASQFIGLWQKYITLGVYSVDSESVGQIDARESIMYWNKRGTNIILRKAIRPVFCIKLTA